MTPDRRHLESLDVFRGATIAAMIVVNNPGDWNRVFPTLVHANWNGLTVADLVFPFFVFIMGCAMPFAFARREAQSDREWRAGWRVLRRAATLIALGLLLNLAAAWPHASAMRVPGVLQRLGLAYLFAALIVRSGGTVAQGIVAVVLLAAHWLVMTHVPFGGYAAGTVTRAANLAGYIDARVFGSHTLARGFDPEGLLGTAPTVATALIGALAGEWLRRHPVHGRQAVGLLVGGAVVLAAGLAWATVWPVNKSLWSGSYALVTSGLAAIILAACLYVIDLRGIRAWDRPLLWLGLNPLAIYFLSELAAHIIERPLLPRSFGLTAPKDWFYWHAVAPLGAGGGGEWTSLLFAMGFACCWVVVAAVLYRRGIHLHV